MPTSASIPARLVILGTSASIPHQSRAHAAFALHLRPSHGPLLLVDCGPTTLTQLLRFGLDPLAVAHTFLTHQHGDHVLGLPLLHNARWNSGNRSPIGLHGPRQALDAVRAITAAVYPNQAKRYAARVQQHVHPAAPAEETLLDVRVRSVSSRHGVPGVIYRFDLTESGGSLVITGDTAPSDAAVDLARGADLLLHDATFSERVNPAWTGSDHTSARQAGEVAARAGVRRLGLVHLPPGLVGHEAEIIAEARETFSGEVFVPSDGDVLDLA